MSDNAEGRALAFATKAHAGQCRKYTGDPYITHPIAVADLVRSVPHTPDMICAAYLHDVVEDCGVDLDVIESEFGPVVRKLVWHLTDASRPEHGNRARRKAIDRAHLAMAPADAQTIKLADLIDNTSSIKLHDPKFAQVYLREKRELLAVMIRGNAALYAMAKSLTQE